MSLAWSIVAERVSSPSPAFFSGVGFCSKPLYLPQGICVYLSVASFMELFYYLYNNVCWNVQHYTSINIDGYMEMTPFSSPFHFSLLIRFWYTVLPLWHEKFIRLLHRRVIFAALIMSFPVIPIRLLNITFKTISITKDKISKITCVTW